MEIIFNHSHIMYPFGSVTVFGTLLTGEFIDYQKILPTSWATEVMVTRTQFAEAIDRCSLMAREGKNNLIYLHMQPGGIIKKEAPIDASNVMLICEKCGKPVRVAHKVTVTTENGKNVRKMVRTCKKCGAEI